MSLIGIDVGSSSVKISAYDEEGGCLCEAKQELTPLHPAPGLWEQSPQEVWAAVSGGLALLMQNEALRRDPPKALAVSASGRENFPADARGNPLGNNIMGADIRGEHFEAVPPGTKTPEDWELSCGHMRERMDPVFRLLWWRENHPEILEKAKCYPDWHGYLTLMLCGRNVSESSLVGRWLAYDLKSGAWDFSRIQKYGIPPHFLPEVLPAGTPIGRVLKDVAQKLGLPSGLTVVTGGHDLNCAALGAGVNKLGMACLLSGSYENMFIPTLQFPTAAMLQKGLSVTPHFADLKRSVYAICPTGNAVLNWSRDTVKLSIEDMEQALSQCVKPSPVMALPHLSGAMLHYENGRRIRGTLIGLTLATKPHEIVQAFMEGIAYDDVKTILLLENEGIAVQSIRATGGGTRSAWWTQLKADLTGLPIEVAAVNEPGTFGAAILAGVGAGVFGSVNEAVPAAAGARCIYEPDTERKKMHEERFLEYCRVVPAVLQTIFLK